MGEKVSRCDHTERQDSQTIFSALVSSGVLYLEVTSRRV